MRGVAESRNQRTPQPRPQRTMHGMLIAILVLVLLVGGMTGLLGRCSFNPGGPDVDGAAAPTVDVSGELESAAERVDFPLTHPQLSDAWRANSANVVTLDSGTDAVRIGWLTGAQNYLRLSQSPAAEEEFVTAETRQQPRAEDTVEVAGQQWVVYESIREEQAWVTERDGVRLLITGDGRAEEFRELAEATLRATPER